MTTLINRFAGTFQLVFVIAVIGGAMTLSSMLKSSNAGPPAAPASSGVQVSVVVPPEMAYTPSVRLNGVVEARTVTNVIPQVSGRVTEVSHSFRPGSLVAAGDVLFRIDSADYELAVERTMAEIEGARSDLALLEAQSAAERQVWNRQFPDRKIPDLIAQVPQIAAAKARIRSGEAARETALLALERTVVRAPFAARVLDTELDIGQVVGGNVAVGSLFSIESLEIAVPVSTSDLGLIGEFDQRRATLSSERLGGRELTGTVVRKAAALDERTRLGTLYVVPDDRDSLIVGEFVSVEIDGQDTPSALRVPDAAMAARDQVWVVEDGMIRERRVDVIGNEYDDTIVRNFDIAEGVVAVPPANARTGLPVTVKRDGRYASSGGTASASR